LSQTDLPPWLRFAVKIKRPVSGIAMGLISDEESKSYKVLSDILGDEDHMGDMDFKVAGTRMGITATQMDIKVKGLTYEIMRKALEQARVGRMHILDKLEEAIAEPRPDYKPHVPRIVQITVPKEMIGAIIGPGGKVIQDIQAKTGTVIVIEEIDSVGVVDISSADKASIEAALERIRAIIEVPEVGKIYKGVVKGIQTFGAFIEILPGKQGLLHISEISWERTKNVEDILKEGDTVEVKLIDIDEKKGNLRLSRKALLPRPEGMPDEPESKPRSHDRRPPRRDHDRNHNRDRNRN
jgi:polyribonucleotide nucleotidyltransferase